NGLNDIDLIWLQLLPEIFFNTPDESQRSNPAAGMRRRGEQGCCLPRCRPRRDSKATPDEKGAWSVCHLYATRHGAAAQPCICQLKKYPASHCKLRLLCELLGF